MSKRPYLISQACHHDCWYDVLRKSPYKKLHDNVAADVDAASEIVAGNPAIGERKKGDLADLFVYKFRSQNQLYLLGYTVDEAVRLIYLEAVGPHENLYRDLKRS